MNEAELIYLLCAATSLAASGTLLRYYYLANRAPMLLWSAIGFLGLAVNNVCVYLDLVLFPEVDLSLARTASAAVGVLALVYGLTRGSVT